jgi:hypothetical protein
MRKTMETEKETLEKVPERKKAGRLVWRRRS